MPQKLVARGVVSGIELSTSTSSLISFLHRLARGENDCVVRR